MDPKSQTLLGIYLNDHLAGAAAALALLRRSLSRNGDHPVGVFLTGLEGEIEADRDALLSIMERLNVSPTGWKQVAARGAVVAGQLKPNGRLLGYSPLSRLEELEALSLGVEGKVALWRALAELSAKDRRLQRAEIDALEKRARAQREELEKFRVAAALEALADS